MRVFIPPPSEKTQFASKTMVYIANNTPQIRQFLIQYCRKTKQILKNIENHILVCTLLHYGYVWIRVIVYRGREAKAALNVIKPKHLVLYLVN